MRKRSSTSREVNAQLSLFRRQGGARKGAGRPKANGGVLHRARPKLSRHHPAHVTLRVAQGLESLRNQRIFSPIRSALPAARERFGPWHLDPCSSAPDFRGWQPGELLGLAQHGASRTALEPCTVCARTFLLRSGWHRHGLLRLDEDPA